MPGKKEVDEYVQAETEKEYRQRCKEEISIAVELHFQKKGVSDEQAKEAEGSAGFRPPRP